MSRLNPDDILDKWRAWKMNQLSAHIQGTKLNVLHRATKKAYEMSCSRKIVTVEIFRGEHNTTSSKLYVKSAINRSYGETRKFVILLNSENIPEKSNCKCSVYQVDWLECAAAKNFNDIGEKLLKLIPIEVSKKVQENKRKFCANNTPAKYRNQTSSWTEKINNSFRQLVPKQINA